ncbi:uncharacterized protein RJT21DRAFT_11637 [Scheffersomyces amazonensis]|uniref:uncharacterized protein n=1 Tax=Scheffersomyces amazonensis TaxID=1078765 RepID=UPI00315D8F24
MKLNICIAAICQLAGVVNCLGFSGKFVNIPTEVDELFKQKNAKVLNGDNYQSKFSIELYPWNNTASSDISGVKALLYKDYSFTFDDITAGEYELLVSSYDFELVNERYRVLVDGNKNEIVAIKDDLRSPSVNVTSGVTVSYKRPLEIEFASIKQFYQYSGGTLTDMILSSPLGFIFKNQTYTMIFVVAIGVMIAPTILQYINPELADQFNPANLQERLEQSTKVQQDATVKTQPIGNKPVAPANNNQNIRKRNK